MQEINYRVPDELIARNHKSMILSLQSSRFTQYGRVIEHLDVQPLIERARTTTPIPQEGNLYVPSVGDLEAFPVARELASYYGNRPIQIGFCNGRNMSMNGMEYHKSPEIVIAVTDCVLFLCPFASLNEFDTVKTTDAELFYLPKGSVALLDDKVLHLAPCMVDRKGFQTIIVLPKETNEPLDAEETKQRDASQDREDRLLFKKNKWMIAHPERMQLVNQHVHVGLVGDNRVVNPL